MISHTEVLEKQTQIWNRLAFIIPTLFAIGGVMLCWLEIMHYHTLFLVTLGVWGITALTWWIWTIYTIVYLARMLNNSVDKITELKKEIFDIRKSISDE